MKFLEKIFGDENTKELKKYQARVPEINAFEESISKLSDTELGAKTAEFKDRLLKGETTDDILPEAFAVVREASKRLSGERHYDVQLIGGMVIHDRGIAEMRTGEGKTLVATLPVYLNALSGKGVHVVTVNDYLARRDGVWMGQIYAFLGLTLGVINGNNQSFLYDPGHTEADAVRDAEGSYKVVYEFLRPTTRTEAYQADITYGTNSEFGFDYLRDNIELEPKNLRQRGHNFAVVDEIDSILIDEARTPLIISTAAADAENLYELFAGIATKLDEETDFEIDEKHRAIQLTESGIEKAEKALGVDNIYTEKGMKHVHHLETAVRAKALFKRDKQYVVREGQIVIVDEFTGRLQPSRRWSGGLHQAIEAKEGLAIQKESRTYASITYQNYFKLYDKLAGMTGTAETSAEEFIKVYRLTPIVIPTNKPIQRVDRTDLIYQTQKGKFEAIAKKVKELQQKGQPVLVGTVSIEDNEALSHFFKAENIAHEILNAKNHEREGEIIAEAGEKGRVTIATNMAGRGVDIKLGGVPFDKAKYEEVKALGGLFVIGTERHEARRIDNQLRGRSGRQGDPGETQFYVSLEDNLMRVFANDMIKNMMGRFGIPEDMPIENKMVSRQLESAQTKIEGHYFDARKRILEFDNVLNTQRESIYKRRRSILLGDHEAIDTFIEEVAAATGEDLQKVIQEKLQVISKDDLYQGLRRLLLQSIDALWVDHLEVMEFARSSVSLRTDPLVEYKKEGKRLFEEMQHAVYELIIKQLPNLGAGLFAQEEERLKKVVREAQQSGTQSEGKTTKPQPAIASSEQKIGRNDTVTIVKDGQEQTMKYKKAEALLDQGWTLKS